MKKLGHFIIFLLFIKTVSAQYLLIPMDLTQTDHLKAYGIAYMTLQKEITVEWLLNYRGGSFLCSDFSSIREACQIRGVRFEQIDGTAVNSIYAEIEEKNMDKVRLEKAPVMAVYSPPGFQPWDDAVTLALTYAEIKYDNIYDREVLAGKLNKYDWLHLHHEDFTGQYGKFWGAFRNQTWYIKQQIESEKLAHSLGFKKVSQLKLTVAKDIKKFVKQGGFLFAMCSATDTFDIALSAENLDIIQKQIDGDGMSIDCQNKLDYSKCLFFTNFKIITNPYIYEFSNIDVNARQFNEFANPGDFSLFDFAAKFDRPPTILTQNHVR